MCGIAGIVGVPDERVDLESALGNLLYQNLESTALCKEVTLGDTRLSIIDAEGGKQPIANEDGTVCIVCNGAIYNHRNLRGRLKNNHTFQTQTDAEVVLHLYEELGDYCIDLLDGIFALAIYDMNRGLLLARDPVGVKPLYISQHKGSIRFASAIKALQNCASEFEVFPAGHCFTTRDGFRRFFTVCEPNSLASSADDAGPELRLRLEKAVEKRLVSDGVPAGVYLSGGLDSSIVAAVAGRKQPRLHTFSVGMENSEDRIYARMCAEHIGSIHHERIYDLDDMLTALPEVIYYLESYDAPLVRSAIPNYFLAKLAAEHVKIALSGEGADELFGGYHYLKGLSEDDASAELVDLTRSLHNTGLQRCDRMSTAYGIECRVPFLDRDMIRFAFSLPLEMKLGEDQMEKWILRRAFRNHLPEDIVHRRKSKFSEGCGSSHILTEIAEDQISDIEFARQADAMGEYAPRSKEELMYYRVYRLFYPSDSAHRAVGFSNSL